MQNRFGLLDTDVMPIFMIIALDIVITLRFSINCSTVICSLTLLFAILREASSETYGPRVYFPLYQFPIYYFAIFSFPIYKPKIPKIFTLPFIYLYQISLLRVTVKGLTTLYRVGCKLFDCLCRYSATCSLSPTRLIHWFSKLREILTLLCYITLSSSREKPTQAQEVALCPYFVFINTSLSL